MDVYIPTNQLNIIGVILLSSLGFDCFVFLQVLKQQNQEPLVIGSEDHVNKNSDALLLEQEVEHFKRVKLSLPNNFTYKFLQWIVSYQSEFIID